MVAMDFGAVLNGEFNAEDTGETTTYGRVILAPWFSLPLGEADLYVSAGMQAYYKEELAFIPELYRLEFYFKLPSLSALSFRVGRIPWLDPSRFTLKGSFDGADILLDLGKIRFGAAALYTGFLYKDTAEINISPGDPVDYGAVFDWGNFKDTYFAPPRVIAALYSEFPGLLFQRGNLYAGFLAQFDCSDAEEPFHTQYLLLRFTYTYKRFDLAAAGAVELENTKAEGFRTAYAFSLEGGWQTQLPFALKDRLSLGLRWASGSGSYTGAFFPLIREAQGLALKPLFSGIMIIKAQYEARLLPSLSAELGCRYFIRTDSTSFSDPDLEDNSYLVGAEADVSLLWVPFSDLSFSLAGGVFLPQTGNALRSGTPIRWSLTLGTIFSF